jgi:hypothetical protein
VFEDKFNRADDTNLGADWTEASGTWEIASNELVCSTANSCIYSTTVTQDDDHYSIQMKGSNDGDCLRISAYSTTASMLFYVVELKVGADAKLRIYRDPGFTGTLTLEAECDVIADENVWHTLNYYEGRIFLNGDAIMNWSKLEDWGRLSIGTGSLTGTAYFDDVSIAYSYDAALHPTCRQENNLQWFLDDDIPASITAVVNGSGITGLDGTYVLDFNGFASYEYDDGTTQVVTNIPDRSSQPDYNAYAQNGSGTSSHFNKWTDGAPLYYNKSLGCGRSMVLDGPDAGFAPSPGSITLSY